MSKAPPGANHASSAVSTSAAVAAPAVAVASASRMTPAGARAGPSVAVPAKRLRPAICRLSRETALSKAAGKVGYAILPQGPSGKSMNMWGGSGIGINGFASAAKKRAAWLFIVWATSPDVQVESLRTVGGTPTRKSVFELPEIKKAMSRPSDLPGMLSTPAALTAWEEAHFGLRPKTPFWLRINNVVFTQLSTMLAGAKSPEQAMKDAAEQIDEITGN